MSRFSLILKLLIMGIIFNSSQSKSFGQNEVRKAVVAGSFYPGNPMALRDNLETLFKESHSEKKGGRVRALIVPHAGYSFSGSVAAAGYKQIDPDASYKNIFIIASSHHVSLGKASVYNLGNYLTPLGEVPVNVEIANKLIQNNDSFVFQKSAHSREHSIEVQLPFIQHYFTKPIPIIPIVLATQDSDICKEVAQALSPYFTEENLFIISADFSHYTDYQSAIAVDKKTADAFCEGDPEKFLSTIRDNSRQKIPGLVTSMCAWPAGLTLLYLSQMHDGLAFKQIIYQNSGDSSIKTGRSEVVGYHAITLTTNNKNGIFLNDKAKKELLEIARQSLVDYIPGRQRSSLNSSSVSPELNKKTGAFVSLKKNGKLRGCIGTFQPDEPLYLLVQSLTIASATEDTRFLPVQKKELKEIEIEISLLTPRRKIDNIDEIILGKHGIYITKEGHSGTFLPQIATQNGWKLEEFLGHCSKDKAGIGWDGWENADIYIYEAIVFKE